MKSLALSTKLPQKKKLLKKLNYVDIFQFMVDEVRCFKEEKLAITIRFANEFELEERFFFFNCLAFRDALRLQNLTVYFCI